MQPLYIPGGRFDVFVIVRIRLLSDPSAGGTLSSFRMKSTNIAAAMSFIFEEL